MLKFSVRQSLIIPAETFYPRENNFCPAPHVLLLFTFPRGPKSSLAPVVAQAVFCSALPLRQGHITHHSTHLMGTAPCRGCPEAL